MLLIQENLKGMSIKKAILLVTFGTSKEVARESFNNIEVLTRKRFPGIEVRWAYTSGMIRKKLAKQGSVVHSPQMALAQLSEDGYTHIAVQSLHTISGVEYDKLRSCVEKTMISPALFSKITIGTPLLLNHKTTEKVMQYLLNEIPAEREPGDAVIIMGHGTEKHYADLVYTAAASILNELDPRAYMGTVDGYNKIERILQKCIESNIKKAYLMPFMSVAGDHALNDMAGSKDDSWKSILENAGIQCEIIMKGTAEYDSIVQIWLNHLEIALDNLLPLPESI